MTNSPSIVEAAILAIGSAVAVYALSRRWILQKRVHKELHRNERRLWAIVNVAPAWSEFIERHQDVITACDFSTAEVFTPQGLISYYVLFFIKIGSREVHIAGVTPHPDEDWIKQVARNITMADWGFLWVSVI